MEERAAEDRESTPDARYLLANERTYLAWMRTCLAFIVGGTALSQFGVRHGFEWLRAVTVVLAILGGVVMTPLVYLHWRTNERALRTGATLPGHHLPTIFLVLTVVIGIGLIVLLIFTR